MSDCKGCATTLIAFRSISKRLLDVRALAVSAGVNGGSHHLARRIVDLIDAPTMPANGQATKISDEQFDRNIRNMLRLASLDTAAELVGHGSEEKQTPKNDPGGSKSLRHCRQIDNRGSKAHAAAG